MMDCTEFDSRISTLFFGGERRRRQLRLTDEEAAYLASHYPVAMEPMGEQWYEITFQGAQCG